MDSETPNNLPSVAGDSSPVDESQKHPQQGGIKLSKKERRNQWYLKNKERLKSAHQKWVLENPIAALEKSKRKLELEKERYLKLKQSDAWRLAFNARQRDSYKNQSSDQREKDRESLRRWRKQNPEKYKLQLNSLKAKATRDEWKKQNPDIVKRYAREWARKNKNPEKTREQRRRWVEANRKRDKKNRQNWVKNNPSKVLASVHKRRAIKQTRIVDPEAIESFIKSIKSKPFIKCFHCGNKVKGKNSEIDHVIPLDKGGIHAVANLAASCRPCNRSKGCRTLDEWNRYKKGQLILI